MYWWPPGCCGVIYGFDAQNAAPVWLGGHDPMRNAPLFEPSKLKDDYESALKALVRRKAKGHTIEAPEEPERPSNVINLMDALRQSVAGEKGRSNARKKSGRASTSKKRRRAA